MFGWFGTGGLSQEGDEAVISRHREENNYQFVDEREMRRQQFVSELTEQYKEHTQRQLSQLPLVGLNTRTPRGYTLGYKLLRKTLSRLVGESPTHVVMDQTGPEGVVECDDGFDWGSDLSCIGMNLYGHSPADGDWGNYRFDFALPNQSEEPSLYPLVGLYDKDSKTMSKMTSAFDSPALMRFKYNIAHMFDQILGVDFEPERTLLNQANDIINSWSVRALRLALNNKDNNHLTERNDNQSVQTIPTEETVSSMGDTATDIDYLSGWEMFVNEPSYVVYRKPFADTGLYQFKVIGTYKDVTAKDFFEVQVSRDCGDVNYSSSFSVMIDPIFVHSRW